MTDNPVQTPTQPTLETVNPPVSLGDAIKGKIAAIFSSWQARIAVAVTLLAGLFLVFYLWQHIIAVVGMNSWASRAHAKPIECMIKDTNNDQYVSCSALLQEQVVPLECSASIWNIGCRVNYGAAAAPVRKQPGL